MFCKRVCFPAVLTVDILVLFGTPGHAVVVHPNLGTIHRDRHLGLRRTQSECMESGLGIELL